MKEKPISVGNAITCHQLKPSCRATWIANMENLNFSVSTEKHRELKYKCDLCDFKCPAEYRLRQHLNSKHEGHQSKRKKLKEDEK